MLSRFLVIALGAGIGMASADSATAATLYLGLQEAGVNGGAILPVSLGNAATGVSYNAAYGTFSINNISAFDQTGYNLSSTASTTAGQNATAGQTLHVWISERDLTTAVNANQSIFKSTLTQNTLPPNWSVTESTYISFNNSLWGTENLLASKTFTGLGTDTQSSLLHITGAYSITEEVAITIGALGSFGDNGALSTIDMRTTVPTTIVPEASTWAMTLLGFASLGFAGYRQAKVA
jgi:hypothetical protein